jgi:hypothetical protein
MRSFNSYYLLRNMTPRLTTLWSDLIIFSSLDIRINEENK